MPYPKLIAITGKPGCGKETVGKIIAELNAGKKIVTIRFSDLLTDILNLLDLPRTRYNLQHTAIFLNDGFGKGTITRGMEKRILNTEADIIILDGARWDSDLEMIKRLPNNTLIYVETDSKIRFERMKARKEKSGEEMMSWEEFEKSEQVKTETYLEEIKKSADFAVENNGTVEDLGRRIRELEI